MKTVSVILKVVAALAAVAGVVYVVATYGDKIVAWAKKLLGCSCDCDCDCDSECECECECECDAAAAEEAAPAEEGDAVAEEKDFEGQ